MRKGYLEKLEAQGFVCAICGCPPPDMRCLSLDHDHTCCPDPKGGGCAKCSASLLCRRCNWVLGQVCDDPELLHLMASYVRRVRVKYRNDSQVTLEEIQ